MSNNYDCLSITKMFKTSCLLLILGFSFFSYSQIGTQKTSIRSGVTFQWEDIQDTNNNGTIDDTENNRPATISSITVNGTAYNTFVVPTSYELTRLGPGGHSINAIRENNNTVISGSNSAGGGPNSSWNSAALAAFQDKNLNHYYTSNGNGRNICLNFGLTFPPRELMDFTSDIALDFFLVLATKYQCTNLFLSYLFYRFKENCIYN